MTGANRCHICHGAFRRHDFVDCDECGGTYHESCLEYHQEYECPESAEDVAVGAVEL